MSAAVARFWSKVDKSGECWIWIGQRSPSGYGVIKVDGKNRRAHRFSFELAHGKEPMPFCCHSCDNPACVRPDHLFEGTPADNSADMARKGRAFRGRGTSNSNAKLTEEGARRVRALVAAGLSQRAIGEQLGISQGAVWLVAAGKTWRHIR